MKKLIYLIAIAIVPVIFSCSSSKEIIQRRSLMMPRLSEQPRNAGKYKEVTYTKKTNNQKKAYKRRTSRR